MPRSPTLRTGQCTIRRASDADCTDIAAIYNEAVLDGNSTFDSEPVAPERYLRYSEPGGRAAIVCACIAQQVVGWASVEPVSDRHAYRYTALGSLYIKRTYRQRGIGRTLIRALDSLALEMGYHSVLGEILSTNPLSLIMDIRNGYRVVGEIHEAGFRADRWIGLIVVQKILT